MGSANSVGRDYRAPVAPSLDSDQQLCLERDDYSLGFRRDAHLAKDGLELILQAVHRRADHAGNLSVAKPHRDDLENADLAGIESECIDDLDDVALATAVRSGHSHRNGDSD